MKSPGKGSLEREKTRERGRERVKEKGKGKRRDREGSRGEWSPGYGWIMRLEAGGEAVWEVAGLSEFTVRSPNQGDSGHFHYPNIPQICCVAGWFSTQHQ